MDEPSPYNIHTASISPQAKSTVDVKSVDAGIYSKTNYKHKIFFKELNILVPKRLTYAGKCAIIISRTTKEPPTEE